MDNPHMHLLWSKSRTEADFERFRAQLAELSMDKLTKLLADTKHLNAGVPDALPWITAMEEEIQRRESRRSGRP